MTSSVLEDEPQNNNFLDSDPNLHLSFLQDSNNASPAWTICVCGGGMGFDLDSWEEYEAPMLDQANK